MVEALCRAAVLAVVCAAIWPSRGAGQSEDAAVAAAAGGGKSLRVGYAGSPPFVLSDDGAPQGLSIAVWQGVAREIGRPTDWRRFSDIPLLLDAVASGEVEVGVGPISVTAARAAKVDFVHPYFSARVGILSPAASSAWERVRPLFSRAFLVGVLTLLVVLLGVGTLIWQAERRKNPEQFPQAPLPGIANGMWFALVTMTTVGYGDRAPVSLVGRILTSVWMVLAMVAASSITAGIASALTLSQIETGSFQSLDDLAGRRVAVVAGTPAEKLARRRSARRVVLGSREAALQAVRRGEAEAMLYDLPVLDYYLQKHPELPLVAHGTPVNADDYAFALPLNSPLRRPIERALLELRESGEITEIASEWLGQQQ